MLRLLRKLIQRGLEKQVAATGLGVFRILVGLIAFQEILFLAYFHHLIFDTKPYIDMATPVVDIFLAIWAVVALCLTIGYRTRAAAVAHYLLWIVFVGFTPMWLEFDGGFDQLMVSVGFVLLFLPSDRALSVDNLRKKLAYSSPGKHYQPRQTVSVLCYTLPLAMVLGLLYLDAGIHKLSAEFWRNGLGAWLPSTMPYYMSGLDMSWLLNQKLAQQFIGYLLIAFQFLFLPLFWFRPHRISLLIIGVAFHTGIILSLNIYQFGFAMLAPYALLVPFRWWRGIGKSICRRTPAATVFYDEQCPLCNRTVIVLRHIDICKSIDFKGLQSHARDFRQLDAIPERQLLRDIYALDRQGRLYAGLDTYLQILKGMVYPAPVAWLLQLPGFYHAGKTIYRRIADNRERIDCDSACALPAPDPEDNPYTLLYRHHLGTPRRQATRIAKFIVLVIVLQLNSTLQFGVFYRLNGGHATTAEGQLVEGISNAVLLMSHTFLGITPHALYMHDHLVGYNHILGITYRDRSGVEQWLPLVNPEGRIVAPNWGRVQCWWANIAVTPHIKRKRLDKALMQITAFWGHKLGLNLQQTEFTLKMKQIRVPMVWEKDLRDYNLRQPWRDIGVVKWIGETVQVETPGIDLEHLTSGISSSP